MTKAVKVCEGSKCATELNSQIKFLAFKRGKQIISKESKQEHKHKSDIAFKGQQERLYQVQNNLRKEQASLDKIRNKDSAEYQEQLKKVVSLQGEEATQRSTVDKARITNQQASKEANKAEVETRNKLRQLTKEQGLAEGSLIEMRTRSGAVALKNNAFNRALIATNEGFVKSIDALKNPTKSFTDTQTNLSNKIVDLRSNLGQVGTVASRSFTGMAASAKASFATIGASAAVLGQTIQAAFISTSTVCIRF